MHIENILTSAAKIVCITRRVKFKFTRVALNKYIFLMYYLFLSIIQLFGIDLLHKTQMLLKYFKMRQLEL